MQTMQGYGMIFFVPLASLFVLFLSAQNLAEF